MIIDREEVKTYREHWMCSNCLGGEFEPTGICLTSMPPQYPHVCDVCGLERNASDIYPRIIHTSDSGVSWPDD